MTMPVAPVEKPSDTERRPISVPWRPLPSMIRPTPKSSGQAEVMAESMLALSNKIARRLMQQMPPEFHKNRLLPKASQAS